VTDLQALVTRMRESGMRWCEINEQLGYTTNSGFLSHCYSTGRWPNRRASHSRPTSAEPPRLAKASQIPQLTLAGMVWIRPVRPPKSVSHHSTPCANCPLEGKCREAVANGDFVGCERPLEREII